MDKVLEQEFETARRRGQAFEAEHPRATSVEFKRGKTPADDMTIVHFDNGCAFMFPPRQVQGLEQASRDELAKVSILGAGYALSWEGPDVDISIPGLMNGIMGTRRFMQERQKQRPEISSPSASLMQA